MLEMSSYPMNTKKYLAIIITPSRTVGLIEPIEIPFLFFLRKDVRGTPFSAYCLCYK